MTVWRFKGLTLSICLLDAFQRKTSDCLGSKVPVRVRQKLPVISARTD